VILMVRIADPSPLAALRLGYRRGVCALDAPCHRGASAIGTIIITAARC
jgi:hypothetical protein